MKDTIAGIGFRDEASLASILDALDRAGASGAPRLALPARKAGHPLAEALAGNGFVLVFIADETIAAIRTPTQSPISLRVYGTGSLCEACALAAAGPGAHLAAPRALSADRLATAALAFTGDPE